MTIVPLVFGLIVTGIASASDAASAGAVTRRALLLFAALLIAAGLFGALATPALLSLWPAPGGAGEAFLAGLATQTQVEAMPPPATGCLRSCRAMPSLPRPKGQCCR
jgi:Na+/H+-dicarboxylate symporter